ncbi:hypothetical protein HK096_011316 [Nowakowskiella sp. JEL0078]|nr:hypothetical protein HK096_011316 [Nowakowskiella sp. JEL0078]
MRFLAICLVILIGKISLTSANPVQSSASNDVGSLIPPVEIVPTGVPGINPSTQQQRRAESSISLAEKSLLLALVNGLRAARGAKSLKMDTRFDLVAQDLASYQASVCTQTHSKNGIGMVARVQKLTGLTNLYLGENVAPGFETVQDVFNSWKNSPEHFANLVNPVFNVVGVAFARNSKCSQKIYWAQDFALVSSQAAIYQENPITSSASKTSTTTIKTSTTTIKTSTTAIKTSTTTEKTSPSQILIAEWGFCTVSNQCLNKCCSKVYSSDGKLKCTPYGINCV